MAQHPEQALYVCDACEDQGDPECEQCGGGGWLLWESLPPEKQDLIKARWYEPEVEEDTHARPRRGDLSREHLLEGQPPLDCS